MKTEKEIKEHLEYLKRKKETLEERGEIGTDYWASISDQLLLIKWVLNE